MAKRKRRDRPAGRSKQRRTTHRGTRQEPDLLDLAAAALDGGPVALLGLASSLLSAVDPRSDDPLEPDAEPEATRDQLLEALFADPLEEATALLAAIAALTGDGVLRKRVARQAVDHAHALPVWLDGIDRAVPSAHAVELVDPFGEMSEIVVGVTLADGQPLSAVASVDDEAGWLLVDGFLLPEAVDDVVAAGLGAVDEGDLTAQPLAPADARARITQAIAYGLLGGAPETETWPTSRASVEWLVGLLPGGGTGYPGADRDDDAVAELARRFRASPFAEGLADPADLLSALLRFRSDHGRGDPVRWSPGAAATALFDWLPGEEGFAVPDLEPAPDVLRALVRFCGDERGAPAALTERLVDEIDAMAPEYRELIRTRRPHPGA